MSKEVADVIDKNMTNIQFMESLMTYSNYGALVQVFVIEAIRNYSESVIADTSVWPDNALVAQATWKGIAQEIMVKSNSKYGKGTESLDSSVKVEEDVTFTLDRTKLQ